MNRLDSLVKSASQFTVELEQADKASRLDGFLQKCPAPIKVLFFMYLLALIGVKSSMDFQAAVFVLLMGLGISSRLPLLIIVKRSIWAAILFGGLIPLPMALWKGSFAPFFVAFRVLNSILAGSLLFYSTSYGLILNSFQRWGVPYSLVIVLAITIQWIKEYSLLVQNMVLAKESRSIGPMSVKSAWKWWGERAGELFLKTQARCDEIWRAITSRTPSGKIKGATAPRLMTQSMGNAAVLVLAAALLTLF